MNKRLELFIIIISIVLIAGGFMLGLSMYEQKMTKLKIELVDKNEIIYQLEQENMRLKK